MYDYWDLKKLYEDKIKENKNLKEQLEMLVKDDEEYQKHIIELGNRIDKAIEYIEKNWIEYSDFQYVDNDDELNIDCESIKELLDILKGSDSNE